MAVYNEILVGRYNRFLQKFFGMKGGPPAPQLSSEVMSIFPFFTGVENRYLEQWNRFGVSLGLIASAANLNLVQLRNPVGSNVMIVLEKITLGSGVADAFTGYLGNRTTDLGTVFTVSTGPLDGRTQSPAATVIPSYQQSVSGAFGAGIYNFFVAANTPTDLVLFEEQELTLLPGTALLLQTVAVNIASRFNFLWRERFLEEGERQ